MKVLSATRILPQAREEYIQIALAKFANYAAKNGRRQEESLCRTAAKTDGARTGRRIVRHWPLYQQEAERNGHHHRQRPVRAEHLDNPESLQHCA